MALSISTNVCNGFWSATAAVDGNTNQILLAGNCDHEGSPPAVGSTQMFGFGGLSLTPAIAPTAVG